MATRELTERERANLKHFEDCGGTYGNIYEHGGQMVGRAHYRGNGARWYGLDGQGRLRDSFTTRAKAYAAVSRANAIQARKAAR